MKKGTPLGTAVWEAERHVYTLEPAPPANNLAVLETDREKLRILDQWLIRDTKLQGALGLRLFPATIAALAKPFEDWSMIDWLNRLEKLGHLVVEDWLPWRETRNRLAHDYPNHPETRFAAIAAAIASARNLATRYPA